MCQLAIRRVLPHRPVVNPDTEDRNGEPLYVVGKYGNATKLRLGRYSGIFSDHGDSGALIFTGEGDMLAILHSGMHNGQYSHVTYGTPIWWVIERLLLQYPAAEFFGIAI